MKGRPAPRRGAAGLAAILFACGLCPAHAAQQLSPVDLIDLEVAYDTLTTQYYRAVAPQRIIDGARVGVVAYLRGRGISDPQVPAIKATGHYAADLHAPGQEVAAAIVRYGSHVDAHALVESAIAGEAAALNDPYTAFFTAEQEREFQRYLNPDAFGGIGIVLHLDRASGRFIVDEVIPGGPAEKGGIAPGDAIVAVDGAKVNAQTASAMQSRLRGPAGTSVAVSYLRGAAESPATVRLVRAKVTPPDAIGRMLPASVGYIALSSFGVNAAKEVAAAIADLRARGARAYVLDLRDNGGGYRDSAIAVTSQFVPAGPVMTVQERNGKRTTLRTDGATPLGKPLAVLVNGNTASAAEITAGAIADTGTGVLVGTKTFGKGLVQRMYPLPDGAALKVTIERYFTAHGHDIDRKGIEPNVAVDQPAGSVAGDPARDPQLARALTELGAPALVTP